MANSDKNILITPNTGSATLNPTIRFTGANNTPITLRTLDTGTVSFEGTAGQLFSIADGLTGTIFSVNDISGIPSLEILDTGLVKLSQYNGQVVVGSSAAITVSSVPAMTSIVTRSATTPGIIIRGFASQSANLQEWQSATPSTVASVSNSGNITAAQFIRTGGTASQYLMADGSVTSTINLPEIIPLDDIRGEFNGIDSIFVPKYQGIKQSITNPLRLQLTINGIIQYVDFPDYVWQSPLPREGFQINNDGNIAFSEVVPAGSSFDARIMPGPDVVTKIRQYPFKAVDILLGG